MRNARRSRLLLRKRSAAPAASANAWEPVTLTSAQRQRIEEQKHIERVLRNARRSRWSLKGNVGARKDRPVPATSAVSETSARESVEPTPAQRQRIEEQRRVEKTLRDARRSRWIQTKRVVRSRVPTEASPSAAPEEGRPTPAQLQRIEEQKQVEKAIRDARRSRWIGKKTGPKTTAEPSAVESGVGNTPARVGTTLPKTERPGGRLLVVVLATTAILLALSVYGLFERAALNHEISNLVEHTRALASEQTGAIAQVQASVDGLIAVQTEQTERWNAYFAETADATEFGFARLSEDIGGLEALVEAVRVAVGPTNARPAGIRVSPEPSGFTVREVDLPDGRRAVLAYPAEAVAAPAVLIIPGEEAPDRDGTFEPQLSGSGESARPLRQVAEYLAARGYATMRYGLQSPDEAGSSTSNDRAGALTALDVLVEQPEVDPGRVSVIAYGASAAAAVSLVQHRPEIANLVLLAPVAETVGASYRVHLALSREIHFAKTVLDTDGDGSVSLDEGLPWIEIDNPVHAALLAAYYVDVPRLVIRTTGGTAAWSSDVDVDGDGRVSIAAELTPYTKRELDARFPADSGTAQLPSALDEIAGVPSSLLILAAGGSLIAPPAQSVMLAQKLVQSYHPDYELVVYDGLGHTFHPVEGSLWQVLGPMDDRVLADLFAWLADHTRESP